MSTPQELIARRSAVFAANSNLNDLVADADAQTSASAYSSNRNIAIALLVCHWLALIERDKQAGNTGVSGQISGERAGKISRSYSGGFFLGTNQSQIDPYLAQTHWGIQLFQLQQSCVPCFFSKGQ